MRSHCRTGGAYNLASLHGVPSVLIERGQLSLFSREEIEADKADVRRSRVRNQDPTTFDIHDRVNYSVEKSRLHINTEKTIIKLKLQIDPHFSSVMDYFEIFLTRMVLCRKAAEKLGLQFKLIINEQQLI